MALKWYTVVVDSADPRAQARWWATALDWQVWVDSDEEASVVPGWLDANVLSNTPWERRGQGLVFVRVPEGKTVKNRLHIDLAPHVSQDRGAEVQRLLDLGATRVDVGQDQQDEDAGRLTVLADPEGNEFCVLSSRDT